MASSGRRRGPAASFVVSPDAFGWDPAVLATLDHPSLPWNDPLAVQPLTDLRTAGSRDRLALVAQFAAHQAFLQFAGIADVGFDAGEWRVERRRGCDVRLVRCASRRGDPLDAPPVLALIREFAGHLGVRLDILRQSWARADAVYADAVEKLWLDAAANLRWTLEAAGGSIAAPGPEGLRLLESVESAAILRAPETLDAIERFAGRAVAFRLVILRGDSPLARYSALAPFRADPAMEPSAVAERIVAATSSTRHLFALENEAAVDEGSRRVIDILSTGRHGTWLFSDAGEELPVAQRFLIAPRLAVRRAVDADPVAFVRSEAFRPYLLHGAVPERPAALPRLAEPIRSFLGALAMLGREIRCDVALAYLADFLFTGPIEALIVDGVTECNGDTLRFVDDAIRREAMELIPQHSRATIARAAAPHATALDQALLWIEAGEQVRAADALAAARWPSAAAMVEALHRVPASALTPELKVRFAHALIDCGRYRDAMQLATGDAFVLARAERRMGDYALALGHLESLTPALETRLLQAEILRILEREPEALLLLEQCTAESAEQQIRLDFERALHGRDVSLPEEHYLASRLETYRALDRGDFESAAKESRRSYERARDVTERIDAALDRLFAVFCSGRWDEARAIAVESLREVEETQGDRAAGGILFTLAYLAADDGQWAHATHRIAQLRRFYAATCDTVRLKELDLLQAHLDFSRGRFDPARRGAEAIYRGNGHHGQIREAAALILDELDWIDGVDSPLRSRGRSGNAELTRRHRRIAARELRTDADADGAPVPDRLFAFRRAAARHDDDAARRLARDLDLIYEPPQQPSEIELRMLRAAATREYPFDSDAFDLAWCHATRNRLGHWSSIGSVEPRTETLESADAGGDWVVISERERLYVEGSAAWCREGRESVAALFRLRAENHRLRRALAQEEAARAPSPAPIDGIVGHSAAIREVAALIARVATRDVPVCILGESGTGKELVARAIHRQSKRRAKAFTPVNCAALPEQLIESELFGHVRGAFTGADRDRAGLIETTDGGTLFLDEIGELPLQAQAKLLRFLQEGEFRRVGDVTNRTADVRIVSATNRRLETAVEEARFREDLYYRIRGVEVLIPPLRQRGNDVLLLAAHFLAAERARHGSGPSELSGDVEGIFTAYRWPGNVRELQNTIRAAHAMAGDAKQIDVGHLPERLRTVAPSRTPAGSYQQAVESFKRELIARSLAAAEGNQNRAAAMLRMSRQALAYQIRELGILVRDVVGR